MWRRHIPHDTATAKANTVFREESSALTIFLNNLMLMRFSSLEEFTRTQNRSAGKAA
jgi:hypothetical protein